jgi:hypothetical protein
MTKTAAVSPQSLGVEIGSIFESSWGYDQTNVDFYKVVGLTPSGVKVVKIGKRHTTEYTVVPDPEVIISRWPWELKDGEDPLKPMTKRLKAWTSGGHQTVAFKVASYADAYLWDGVPQYETPAGMGR